MKEGWKMVKLGKIVTTSNGLWKGKKPPYINIAVIRNTNFTKDCKLRLDDIEYIDAEEKQFLTRKLEYGDIIIEKSGGSDKQPVGRPVLFNIKEGNFSYSNFTSRIRIIDNKIIDSSFLQKALYNHYIKGSTFPLQSNTTGIHNLDFKGYLELDIPLPPLEEQHRIVSILDASFEKIDTLKKNAEENLKNAKALFQQVLAQELKPKEGWVEKKLGEIGEVFSGFAFKSSSFKTEGRYQIIRIGNIKQDNLRLNESPIFVDIVDDKTLSKSLLYKGDLVVTQTGTRHKRDYGFIAMVKNDNLLLNQRNACIRISDVELAKFVLYYSYTKLYKDDFFANEGGTVGQGNVGISALKEMLISFPTDTEEQHRIVATLDTLSEKCRRLEQVAQQTIRECDALKQSILRQAFSGEL